MPPTSVASASAAKIRRMTREQCSEWAANPTVNPLTGRAIELGKGTYNAIAERCSEAHGIAPGGEVPVQPPRALLPRRMNGYTVPRTGDEWRTSYLRDDARKLYDTVKAFGFVPETHEQMANNILAVLRLLVTHEILPAAERAAMTESIAEIAALAAPDRVRRWAFPVHRGELAWIAEAARGEMRAQLSGAQTHFRAADLRNDLEMALFVRRYYGTQAHMGMPAEAARAEEERVEELLIALTGLEHDLVLMLDNAAGTPGDAYALPESRERSPPASLSRRRVRQKKPKARAEDPDEYYPWSATEEDAPTDRSRFRSHAKLSAVSPGPSPPAGATPPRPLTPKKRTALLAELREACTVMKDMISMQRFDRMNKKALQLVVRLGPKGTGQQRCYYVKNLYQLWAAATKDGQPFRDPLTRDLVTAAEKNDILDKARRVRPGAPDPRAHKLLRDPKLTLDIGRVTVPSSMLDGLNPSGSSPRALPSGDVTFYHVRVLRRVGPLTFTITDLGYVPADLELADVGGDANLTSDAVIANVRELFDKGRLMVSYVPPYRCCRVHLMKPMAYWLAAGRGSPVAAGRMNLRRWKQFASEVYGAL